MPRKDFLGPSSYLLSVLPVPAARSSVTRTSNCVSLGTMWGQRAPQEGDTLGKSKVSWRRAPAHSFQSILQAFSPLFILNYLIHQDIC